MAVAIAAHAAAFLLAPLLLGVINRTKAVVAGRKGPPVLQPYFDVRKLLAKGATYSDTTTWVFRAAPSVGLAAVIAASLLVPMGGPAVVRFDGDLLAFVGLLALARWAVVLGALDTGSSFEVMGASREVMIGALAEPALLLALAAMVSLTGATSLSGVMLAAGGGPLAAAVVVLPLVALALALLTLAENARIPVDDPTTHLELTMVHEVMVLDNSGPDFAFVTYAAALKLWLFASLIAGVVSPADGGNAAVALAAFLGMVVLVAVGIGVVESTMARLKMRSVPWLMAGASLAALSGLVISVVV